MRWMKTESQNTKGGEEEQGEEELYEQHKRKRRDALRGEVGLKPEWMRSLKKSHPGYRSGFKENKFP